MSRSQKRLAVAALACSALGAIAVTGCNNGGEKTRTSTATPANVVIQPGRMGRPGMISGNGASSSSGTNSSDANAPMPR
jgi:hypothetical protein